MHLTIVLFVSFVVILIKTAEGQLRCYACSYSSADADDSCLTDSDSTRTVDCQQTYCTIMRQEFIDPPGQVASFLRGCEGEPDYLNHEIEDSYFRTYYRACTSSLCNIGNGVQSVVGGNLSPRPEYNGENILVRGTGGGNYSSSLRSNLFICGFVLVILNFLI